MTLLRSAIVFCLLYSLKILSRIFYRHDWAFVGTKLPGNPWKGLRLVVFLNHTSLFEPVFIGVPPASFVWRLAAHGVVPAADKTTDRPLVGMVFRFIAHEVIPITRQRDDTWAQVLSTIEPDSMVVLAPEGRMKRANGLDLHGKPMTVRGGVADILQSLKQGRMLIAYSGGLHHVQIPGHIPNVFKTVRLRGEVLEIADYTSEMMADGGPEQFKRNVIRDLERRRDLYCPEEPAAARIPSPS
ncbi:MAG TPA: 1-acyl-sn-glycerol-3-phosphate acyltransferase [Thermoanaerobaculia bacterium]|nr:1-acyl-sn-glycerol-3-phosphate acyltransferase [Thermoanaerobaculia bacterium]